jgi:hypothetical protein
MTPEKCRFLLDFYRRHLTTTLYERREEHGKWPGLPPCRLEEYVDINDPSPYDTYGIVDVQAVTAHMLALLEEMDVAVSNSNFEKFSYLLGIVQGICLMAGYQSLAEIRILNGPLDTGEATVGDPSIAEIAT